MLHRKGNSSPGTRLGNERHRMGWYRTFRLPIIRIPSPIEHVFP